MKRTLLLALLPLVFTAPASAQELVEGDKPLQFDPVQYVLEQGLFVARTYSGPLPIPVTVDGLAATDRLGNPVQADTPLPPPCDPPTPRAPIQPPGPPSPLPAPCRP